MTVVLNEGTIRDRRYDDAASRRGVSATSTFHSHEFLFGGRFDFLQWLRHRKNGIKIVDGSGIVTSRGVNHASVIEGHSFHIRRNAIQVDSGSVIVYRAPLVMFLRLRHSPLVQPQTPAAIGGPAFQPIEDSHAVPSFRASAPINRWPTGGRLPPLHRHFRKRERRASSVPLLMAWRHVTCYCCKCRPRTYKYCNCRQGKCKVAQNAPHGKTIDIGTSLISTAVTAWCVGRSNSMSSPLPVTPLIDHQIDMPYGRCLADLPGNASRSSPNCAH